MNDGGVLYAPPVADTNRQRLRSLRARLLLLIAGVAVPLIVLAIGAVWQAHLSERSRVEARLMETARALAATIDNELQVARVYLGVIAASPSVATGDWVSVHQQSALSVRRGSFVAIFDDQGRRLLGTAFPLPAGVDAVTQEQTAALVRRALADNRFVVSNLAMRQQAGPAVIVAGVPAATRSGQRVVLALITPASELADALRDQSLPPDWIAAILDTDDVVIARTRDPQRFVGTRPVETVRAVMRGKESGLATARTSEDFTAVLAFARAQQSGFAGVIAIPETVFGQAFLATIAPVAAIGISLLAAAMGIAMLASSRILSAVRRDYAVHETRRERDAAAMRIMDAELRASERKFETIADAVPQLIWSALADGRHDYFNNRWHDFTGMAQGLTTATAWTDYVHADDRRRATATWNAALSSGEPFESECRVRSGDNSHRWFMARAVPVRGQNGAIERWFGSCTDIHDKKLAEQALVTAQAQLEARVLELESLYDYAPVGLGVIDRELRFLRVNDALAAMTGRKAAAHLGQPVEAVLPQIFETLKPIFAKVLGGETFRDIDLEGGPEGERRVWRAHFYPVRQDAGEVAAIGAICEDVTAARAAEDALNEEKARLEHLMIASPNMIYVTDLARGRNQFINPQVFDSLGYAPAELSGRTIKDLNELVHPEDMERLIDLTTTVRRAADGEVIEAEYRIRHADGAYRWFLIRETPFQRDAEGKVTQVLGTGLDINARKYADDHQQMLIRELHHRVKNILATVQAIASATGRSSKSYADFRDDFSNRLISLGRTHSLLTNEAWAGAELHEILKSELEPYVGAGGDRVTIEGPHVTIPRDMVVSVGMAVHELTTNAAKYGSLSVPTGRVHITVDTDNAAVEPKLTMTWRESGGPEVKTPDRRGFGSLLLNRLLASQLGGDVAIDYRPEGIVARMELTLRPDSAR